MTDETSAASSEELKANPASEPTEQSASSEVGEPETPLSGTPQSSPPASVATEPALSATTDSTKVDPATVDPAAVNPAHGDLDGAAPNALGDESSTDPSPRSSIQVGSRRGEKGEQIRSSKPLVSVPKEFTVPLQGKVVENAPSAPVERVNQAPVAVPSRRDPLSPDLEQELQQALGNVSLDTLVNEPATTEANQELEVDTRRPATVSRLHGDNVFFSLGGRNEGFVSVRQFKDPPDVGAEFDIVVNSYHADDGLYELRLAGTAVNVADWSDLTEGAVVEARISGANTGGLECMLNAIRGFIPASQIALFRVEEFGEYIGQKLPCVVMEVNPRKRNLVLSHRAFLEREREESRKQLLESLEAGQTVEGIVSNLRDFGAFVDLGGVDGLIHISQLSWDRIDHPKEVLEQGQKVRVRIEKVNPETGKISLAYRDLSDHPWTDAEATYTVGDTVTGPISRIAKFGAFVKLAPGVEGLIHISEIAHRRIRQVSDVVSEGQEVETKILSVDAKAQRIGLSLRAAQPEPEADDTEDTPDNKSREQPIRRSSPLKGGTDRAAGGDQFGLKW